MPENAGNLVLDPRNSVFFPGYPPAAHAQCGGRAAPLGLEHLQQLPRGSHQIPGFPGAALPHLLQDLHRGRQDGPQGTTATQGEGSGLGIKGIWDLRDMGFGIKGI